MNDKAVRRSLIIITCLACLPLLFSSVLAPISGYWTLSPSFTIGPYWTTSGPATVVTVGIVHPLNATYNIHTISVQLNASTTVGSIDKIWYNLQNVSVWVYASNQTYTGVTWMTGISLGTSYTFYAWANASDGTEGSASIMFSVTPTLVNVYLTQPTGTTAYHTSQVPVQFNATSGYPIDKEWFSVQASNGSWIILNQNYVDSSIIYLTLSSAYYYLYANANNTLGNSGVATQGFRVQITATGLTVWASPPSDAIVYGSDFNVFYPTGTTVHFQHNPYANVTVGVFGVGANLNGSRGIIYMTETTGNFTFYNMELTSIGLQSTDPNINLYIDGVAYTGIVSEAASKWVYITWNYYGGPGAPGSPTPFGLPIIFMFGMGGLFLMFIGPAYGIKKFKDKEYLAGLKWAAILTGTGFALFITWLFGGHF